MCGVLHVWMYVSWAVLGVCCFSLLLVYMCCMNGACVGCVQHDFGMVGVCIVVCCDVVL